MEYGDAIWSTRSNHFLYASGEKEENCWKRCEMDTIVVKRRDATLFAVASESRQGKEGLRYEMSGERKRGGS